MTVDRARAAARRAEVTGTPLGGPGGRGDPASIRRRSLLAATAALPACAAAPPSTVPSGPLPSPTVRIGDRWRYRLTDRVSGRWLDEPTWEVAEVSPEIVLKVGGRRGGSPREERYARAWDVVADVVYDVPYRFAEPVPLVPTPLEPGSGTTTSTTYTAPDTPRRRWRQRLTVGGWERIAVPAGEFDCLRIARVVAFEPPDRFRSNASRQDELWYAPAAHRWVRRILRGDYVSVGGGRDNAAEGTQGREDTLLWELTAYLPTPVAR